MSRVNRLWIEIAANGYRKPGGVDHRGRDAPHGTIRFLVHSRASCRGTDHRYKSQLGNRSSWASSCSSRPTSSETVTLDPTIQNALMLARARLVRTFLSRSLVVEMAGPLAVDTTMIDTGTRLAVDRTRLAHERTLMAWVRTATSLISFGFTIYKFFEFEMSKQPVQASSVLGPRGFALIMITIGLAALGSSTVDHRRQMEAMRREFGDVPYLTSAIVATLVAAMGVLALGSLPCAASR